MAYNCPSEPDLLTPEVARELLGEEDSLVCFLEGYAVNGQLRGACVEVRGNKYHLPSRFIDLFKIKTSTNETIELRRIGEICYLEVNLNNKTQSSKLKEQ